MKKARKEIPPGWLKPGSAAEYMNSSRRRIHYLMKNNGLRFVKLGGMVLIKREWIDDFLESQEAPLVRSVDRHMEKVMNRLNDDA
jgi:excisionase family DNA binding protein